MTKPADKIRKYFISDPALKQKCDSIASAMERDAAEFATRGVSAGDIAAFAAQSDAFGEIDSDEEWYGIVGEAKDTRDELADSIKQQVRVLKNIAEIQWDAASGKLRRYGFKGMNRLNDYPLVRLGRRVIKVATAQLTDLAPWGLTSAMLTALDSTVLDFTDAVDKLDDAEYERENAQQIRVEAGNSLNILLAKYCSIGKSLFSKNPAKFNDYVVYRRKKKKQKPAEGDGG